MRAAASPAAALAEETLRALLTETAHGCDDGTRQILHWTQTHEHIHARIPALAQ